MNDLEASKVAAAVLACGRLHFFLDECADTKLCVHLVKQLGSLCGLLLLLDHQHIHTRQITLVYKSDKKYCRTENNRGDNFCNQASCKTFARNKFSL